MKTNISDGYYTVAYKNKEFGEGHRTFRIRTQKQHEWRGAEKARLISYLMGPDNTHDYMRMGEVKSDGSLKVWERFLHNPDIEQDKKTIIVKCLELLFSGNITDKAQHMYAVKSVRCYKCGRELTHQESIAQGIGPCCGGWTYKENSTQAKQRKAKKAVPVYAGDYEPGQAYPEDIAERAASGSGWQGEPYEDQVRGDSSDRFYN